MKIRPLWMLTAVLLALPALCPAQYEGSENTKVALKVGFHQPSGSRARDEANLMPDMGVDYVLRFDTEDRPKDVVSLGYTGASKNLIDAKVLGLQYMRYWSDGPPDSGFYYGAGGGVFIQDLSIDESFPLPAVNESGTGFGFSLMGGYHFGQYYFAEVRYTKLPELANGTDLSGVSAFIGVKRIL